MTKITSATLGTLEEEHGELYHACSQACLALVRIRTALQPVEGAASWMQHVNFADRAAYLSEHLSAAMDLADKALYSSSLSLVRTAMEHEVIDELLLLATLYAQVASDTSDERHEEIVRGWRAGEAWAADVHDIRRRRRSTVVVRRGHELRDPNSGDVVERVSNYFAVLEHHNAVLGTSAVQDLFHDGIGDVEQVKRWARDNSALYHAYLSWSALLENLVLNDLVDSRQEVALGVHYRFLSAFTHSTATGYDLIDRHSGHPSWGRHRPSHYLGELVLLYVANIAHDELRAWQQFVDARPKLIQLEHRSEIDGLVSTTERVAGHLWYRCGEPTDYDRMREGNRRVWKAWERGSPIPTPAQHYSHIPPTEVGYYNDVIDRLEKLHTGTGVEFTTGFSVRPLW